MPETFARWFDERGWSIHPHQQAMLDRADAPALLLIAPTGGGKTLALGAQPFIEPVGFDIQPIYQVARVIFVGLAGDGYVL